MTCLLKIALCICLVFMTVTEQQDLGPLLESIKDIPLDKCYGAIIGQWWNKIVANSRESCGEGEPIIAPTEFSPDILMGVCAWQRTIDTVMQEQILQSFIQDCFPEDVTEFFTYDIVKFMDTIDCFTKAVKDICKGNKN